MGEKTFEEKLEQLPKHRQLLVNEILSAMEKGEKDWVKTWQNSGGILRNYTTERAYNGINILMLTLLSIQDKKSDSRFATFYQVQEKKLKIKKGKKAYPVEYYSKVFTPNPQSTAPPLGVSKAEYDKVTVYMPFAHLNSFEQDRWKKSRGYKAEELEAIFRSSKMTSKEQVVWKYKFTYSMIKAYSVFNGDDIEGIEPEKIIENMTKGEMMAKKQRRLEKIIEGYKKIVSITEDGKNRAFYSVDSNSIHLPPKGSFYSMNDYYSTVLHEMAHSTGHKDKLNRGFDVAEYAKEELRAEFASILLLKEFGADVVGLQIDNAAKYLNAWGKEIKKNPSELFSAIKDADKIVKYVLEFEKSFERDSSKEQVKTVAQKQPREKKELLDNMLQR